MKILLIALTTSLITGCGLILGAAGSGAGIDIDVAKKDYSDITTDTTKEELPKLFGNWEGYCKSGTGGDKLNRLRRREHCGQYSMSLPKDSRRVSFKFDRDYFEYIDSQEVNDCPADAEDCSCYEHEGTKACHKFSVGEGECTLQVTADIKDTVLVEERGIIIFGTGKNRYVRLENINVNLVYFSDAVANTKLPKKEEIDWFLVYESIEKAKATCESFAEMWKSDKEPLSLIYKIDKDTGNLVFPSYKDGAIVIFDVPPKMSFKK